ncbi:HNH endonuclease [Geminocystis sp.]|uniref:HNH endonuclease n=1 Tax=Geminocystis sp. TaxID=2664100 RepID=UPI003593B00C
MEDDLQNLINDIKNTGKKIKQVNKKINSLYQIQRIEKVTNGYEVWRFQENGGVKLVKEQLIILNFECSVCGVKLTEKETTIDHLKPKYKYLGNALSTDNMLIMCRSCNGGKATKELKSWYQNLPSTWQKRLYEAIKKIHGYSKLIELGLQNIKSK